MSFNSQIFLAEESDDCKKRKCSYKREYGKLRTMVPALGERDDITKVSHFKVFLVFKIEIRNIKHLIKNKNQQNDYQRLLFNKKNLKANDTNF